MTVKFPDEIDRFDGDKAVGEQGWKTTVSPLQMLDEVLRAIANADSSCDEVGCTVSYAPGQSDEEWEHHVAFMTARGHKVEDLWRNPGNHYVSLWRREWRNPDDEDEMTNHRYASFLFTTDPPDMFWNGI